MSIRIRTVKWCENSIIKELVKRHTITTYLSLSACVLQDVESIEEQHNLDIALTNLIYHKEIIKEQDHDGKKALL